MKRISLSRDTESKFKEPRHVVESPDLSAEQKVKILENWKLDLLELQRATEENMPSAGVVPGEAAERLQQVNEALDAVRGPPPCSRNGA